MAVLKIRVFRLFLGTFLTVTAILSFSFIFLQECSIASHGNTVSVIRIIGNDLPPRHKPGQTLINIRFILENEQTSPIFHKHWLLNRISDSSKEKAIIQLLEAHNQTYSRIPFNLTEYSLCPLHTRSFPYPDFIHQHSFYNYTNMRRLYVMDFVLQHKNIYAINNNGARNIAIEIGKKQGAKWILPLDGNCFMSNSMLKELISQIRDFEWKTKYFILPMARLTSNKMALNSDFLDRGFEEPQIMFRHDANMRYNETMRYGRRSKMELLWRLGIPFGYVGRQTLPWETDHILGDPEKEMVKVTRNAVIRLFSGSMNQEIKGASKSRNVNRLTAISGFLTSLDIKILKLKWKDEMTFWNYTSMIEQRYKFWSNQFVAKNIVYPALLRSRIIVRENKTDISINSSNAKSVMEDIESLTLAWFFKSNSRFSTLAVSRLNALFQYFGSNSMNSLEEMIKLPWNIIVDSIIIFQKSNIVSTLTKSEWQHSILPLYQSICNDRIAINQSLLFTESCTLNLYLDLARFAMSSLYGDYHCAITTSRDIHFRMQKHFIPQPFNYTECNKEFDNIVLLWVRILRAMKLIGQDVFNFETPYGQTWQLTLKEWFMTSELQNNYLVSNFVLQNDIPLPITMDLGELHHLPLLTNWRIGNVYK